ncbi:Stage V sporulation protein AE (SpoVAE) [Candidatus Hydrogenisulfobacillus filiaventi]|uniref:Stage V sporulation protein AE (SpoVAE) n=1 Tax=Candidatus Hydrogenisulfobacillus filiaventi TaxID=2707344 RepID=A0A6F8ZFI5_9FIRM|nr:stage V sporulation protein AE [Bacillota bacterium]CAB1128694.1 Stage V sporulation protein AE (SpoVAE) [Candidatus Hydrogenisulfobacillus filiaventi]
MAERVPVIVVTDGDRTAAAAVEAAAQELGLEVLGRSAGNPTPLKGRELVDAVLRKAPGPVVVMVDDRGDPDTGPGERALRTLLRSPELDVLGVVAVAADTRPVEGVEADQSVSRAGDLVEGAVDKRGHPRTGLLRGDTVDVLREFPRVPVVGLGDPGKMDGHDAPGAGAPLTRAALEAVLREAGRLPAGRER